MLFQVREHAAAVLAGLMKGGDEDLAKGFRDKAYKQASNLQRKKKKRLFSMLLCSYFINIPFYVVHISL